MNKHVNARNWQMFLRKRISRLMSVGWKPEEISETFSIPKSLVDYHVAHITKETTTIVSG